MLPFVGCEDCCANVYVCSISIWVISVSEVAFLKTV